MNISPGKIQYYKVRVENTAEEFSDFTPYNDGYADFFRAPTNLHATDGTEDNQVVVNWKGTKGALEYVVYRGTTESGSFNEVHRTTDSIYRDTSVTNELRYYYKVKAFNNRLGLSAYSNIDSGYKQGSYKLVKIIGSPGSLPGQFNRPYGLAFNNNNGLLYVSDYGNNRIQVLSPEGVFQRQFGNELYYPRGIAFDNNGNLFIANSAVNNIQKYSPNEILISSWGTTGTGPGQFNYMRAIACDRNGNVYVVDHNNHRVQKFTNDGNFLLTWGGGPSTNPGSFEYPFGLVINNSGNVLVTDATESVNRRIQTFSPSGNLLSSYPLSLFQGSFVGLGIAKDAEDNLYVSIQTEVVKLGPDGSVKARFGKGMLSLATGITVDGQGNVYVADDNDERILKFSKGK
ncbi:NHL repeat-containing protein [Flavihumibacter rivuli]|uniref:NHL repeat-containing protein n=1 Tax=Flavihumibacter rivuli TaxID=2838156 RepID=UPI001BDF0122|nr:NHL repeat-containing protein [Flavihumibacter rivuli]ULQ55960.1 NHL repeat-containing protein [Flavihumibacter rivuli]